MFIFEEYFTMKRVCFILEAFVSIEHSLKKVRQKWRLIKKYNPVFRQTADSPVEILANLKKD